jgi:hypothetical protein
MSSTETKDIKGIAIIDVDWTLIFDSENTGENAWRNETWYLLTVGLCGEEGIEGLRKIYGDYLTQVNQLRDDQVEEKQQLHDEMATKLIKLWEGHVDGGKVKLKHLLAAQRIIENKISESNEVKQAVYELISEQILVIIGSGSYELAAEAIARVLELNRQTQIFNLPTDTEYHFGNTVFHFDENDNLITFTHEPDVPHHKFLQTQQHIKQILLGVGKTEVDIPIFIIGDGDSEKELFKHYFGIGKNVRKDEIKRAVKEIAETWSDINKIIARALLHWGREEESREASAS